MTKRHNYIHNTDKKRRGIKYCNQYAIDKTPQDFIMGLTGKTTLFNSMFVDKNIDSLYFKLVGRFFF